MRKRAFGHVRPAKIQMSICIRAVRSESSICESRMQSFFKRAIVLSDRVDTQSGLSFRLPDISEGMFSHVSAKIYIKSKMWPLETKNMEENEHRRLGFNKSLYGYVTCEAAHAPPRSELIALRLVEQSLLVKISHQGR